MQNNEPRLIKIGLINMNSITTALKNTPKVPSRGQSIPKLG